MKRVLIFAVYALLFVATNVVAQNGNGAKQQQRTTVTETDKGGAKLQASQQQPAGNKAQLYTDTGNADKQNNQGPQNGPSVDNQSSGEGGTIDSANDDNRQNGGKEKAVPYNRQKGTDGESSGGSMTWLIIAAVAALAIYVYYRRLQNLRTKKEQGNGNGAEHQENTPDVAILHREIGELSHRLTSLEKMVQQLNDVICRINDNQQKTPSQSSQTVSPKQPLKSKQLYANILNGNLFQESAMQLNKDEYTVFVLSVVGDKGTFVVNDAPEAQINLISSFAYTVANAVNVRAKANNAQSIVTLQPGKVKKADGGWTIVENATVELR